MLPKKLEQRSSCVSATKPKRSTFNKSKIFQIVLIPLNNRPIRHGGIFDGDDIMHRLMAQQKSSGMNREVAREIENLVGKLQELVVKPFEVSEPICRNIWDQQSS